MRVLIYGTGGVGGYLGAKLWQAGHDVVFLARGSHLEAMRSNGLTLNSPEGSINAKSEFHEFPDNLDPFDLIIFSMKSFDTHAAALRVRSAISGSPLVLTIQNGIANLGLVQEILSTMNILGGVAYIYSTIEEPGVVLHRGGTTLFRVGEPAPHEPDRSVSTAAAFREAGIPCESVTDIRGAIWEKFIFITGLAGMTAFTRQPVGEILADPSLHAMLATVVAETASVARASGAGTFPDIEEKAEANYRRMPPGSTSSMYYDLTHGKMIEVEGLNGEVVRMANKLSIPVPANGEIYSKLSEYVRKHTLS